MKTRTRVVAMAAAWLVFGSVTALWAQAPAENAPEPAVTVTPTVDVLSNYIWRGLRLSKGWVLQPGVTVDTHGVSVNVWGNFDFNEYPLGSGKSSNRLTEVDLTAGYTTEVGRASLTAGVIYYGLADFDDTTELYGTVAFSAPLSPSVSFYYDVDQGDGGFLMASVGHEVKLTPAVPLKLGAFASYCFKHKVMGLTEDGDPISAPYSAEINAAVGIPVGSHLTLSPRAAYAFPLGDKGKTALKMASYDGATSSRFYAGVNLTATW